MFPTTRAGLEEAGYKISHYGRCRGCREAIEWWKTPDDKRIPMNQMQAADSAAISHFATCPQANQFRKEPQRCEPPAKSSTLW